MNSQDKELHKLFEQIYVIKFEKNLYKVEFNYDAPPNGKYVDRTNNQMRKDCCYYLQGAWRLFQDLHSDGVIDLDKLR